MGKARSSEENRCSFCHKAQSKVGKLVSSPSDYPRAYICDECVFVCASIIEDAQPQAAAPDEMPGFSTEMLIHPMLQQLLEAIEKWVYLEGQGQDASGALNAVRGLAGQMLRQM